MASRVLRPAALVTAVLAALLYLKGLPGEREVPGWFFQPIAHPKGPAFALLFAALAPFAIAQPW